MSEVNPSALITRRVTASTLAAEMLSDKLGDGFLGSRQDRGELTLWVEPRCWRATAELLREQMGFTTLSDFTAVDYLDRKPRFDLMAVALCPTTCQEMRIKTMIPEEDPRVDSWVPVWPGVNWYEREVYDLFGITFNDHPNMSRLLLPSDYQGHPLRKDYPVTGPATSVYR